MGAGVTKGKIYVHKIDKKKKKSNSLLCPKLGKVHFNNKS